MPEIPCVLGVRNLSNYLSFIPFQRKLLKNSLPIDWHSEMMVVLKKYAYFQKRGLYNYG